MIARVEAKLGFSLPPDLRASFAIHDGQDHDAPPLFAGLRLLSLEGVVELASWIKDDLAASPSPPARGLPPGTVNDVWESTSWLPIGTDDGGNHISIDLAPAPLGIFGQLIYVYSKHPDRPRIATSFVEFLDARVQLREVMGQVGPAPSPPS